MPPFPCFTIAVPTPGNLGVTANGTVFPTQPSDGTDELIYSVEVPLAMLNKVPRAAGNILGIQFSAWATFDATGVLPVNYFRFRLTPDFQWVSPPFIDFVVGPTDEAFRSALRHFTVDEVGVNAFQWRSSYQQPNAPFTPNPGLFNLSFTIFGADTDGNLPPETAFTPEPP